MKLKKIVRFLSKCEDALVLICCLFLVLLGCYAMYDSYMVYEKAIDNSILKFKPGYESNLDEEVPQEIQGNMVAWISIEDTTIDYPVMQGINNSEYLNKNPYGEYSLSGSIFLDSRNASDFSDGYSLIYGHHMSGDVMFGQLDAYLKESYLESHTDGEIIIDDVTYSVSYFAVLEADARNPVVFAPNECEVGETWAYLSEHAKFWNEDVVTKDQADKTSLSLLALSTCQESNSNDRTLVFGVIHK